MKRTGTILTLTMLALFALQALPGCKSPATGTVDEDLIARDQVLNLDDEYGGYNFGDEAPAFADPSLAADYGPDATAEFTDPMEDDSAVVDARRRARHRRYLMITWGNLRADSSVNFVTDWTGGLHVDNGVVVLKRTIRFDAHDEILPRTSRDLLQWVSHTKPHYDGILVALYKIPAHDSTATDSSRCETPPLSVTFRTAPLQVTFSEDELQDLHRVIRVDDAGNAVAFNTIVVEPAPCGGGFLAGQWKNVSNRPGGIFRGKWISHNGVHMGYLRGAYGPNSRGEKVFFGKWITAGGRFEGLLKGRYGGFDDDRPGGWFEGIWLTRGLRAGGGLRGVWATSDRIDGGGYFRGEWKRRCLNASLQ